MIVSVIGHRQWKLELLIGSQEAARQALCEKIKKEISGASHVVVDAGWGTGLLAGWAAVMIGIPFTVCAAFPGCSDRWPGNPKAEFIELCKRAAHVMTIEDQDDCPASFMSHYEWMIKNTDRLVAVCDGEGRSKTQDAIDYAGAIGKPVSIIDPRG
jgi:uncharacterized phage-like protein YoqJ